MAANIPPSRPDKPAARRLLQYLSYYDVLCYELIRLRGAPAAISGFGIRGLNSLIAEPSHKILGIQFALLLWHSERSRVDVRDVPPRETETQQWSAVSPQTGENPHTSGGGLLGGGRRARHQCRASDSLIQCKGRRVITTGAIGRLGSLKRYRSFGLFRSSAPPEIGETAGK